VSISPTFDSRLLHLYIPKAQKRQSRNLYLLLLLGSTLLNAERKHVGEIDPRSPKKIVILSHDKAFRPGGEIDEGLELKTFLRLVKEHGFTFETLDTYLTDSVNSTSV